MVLRDAGLMETTCFDPSLPGVRLLQTWLREQRALRLELLCGASHEGVLAWQDPEFLALKRSDADQPLLISRRAIAVIRCLG